MQWFLLVNNIDYRNIDIETIFNNFCCNKMLTIEHWCRRFIDYLTFAVLIHARLFQSLILLFNVYHLQSYAC